MTEKSDLKKIADPSMLTNVELWDTVVSFINKSSSDNFILNTNGTYGTFEFSNNRFIIKTDSKEWIYQSEDDIRKILLDGWIIK